MISVNYLDSTTDYPENRIKENTKNVNRAHSAYIVKPTTSFIVKKKPEK